MRGSGGGHRVHGCVLCMFLCVEVSCGELWEGPGAACQAGMNSTRAAPRSSAVWAPLRRHVGRRRRFH